MENAAKSEGIIVVDQEKPGIQAEFTGVDATSKDVIFTDGEDFSVKYTVDENNLDLHDKTLSVTINGTEEIWTLSDVGVVEKALTGEGVYRMIATFIDVANNTPATDTKDYVIDSAAPTITLAQDGLTEINNIYYTDSNSYGLDITVDESLYEVYLAHGVKPVVTVNGEKVDLDWSKPNAKLNLFDEDVYEIVVTYDNLVYEAVTENITIVVDYNEPVITLIPEIDVVENGVYYTAKENYGLKITLTEELYDYYYGLGFKPEVTVNGEAVELDWSKPEATLNLPDNGVYEIVVSYSNCWKLAEDKLITIVVDHEKPVITLTPDIDLVQNNVYYTAKENYGLKISLTDDLYDHNLACGIEPVVTVNGKEEKLDWTKPETVLTLAENGVYEITVNYANYLHTAEEKTITIVVDHEVPVIELIHGIEDPDLLVDGTYYTDDENYKLTIHLTEDLYDYYLTCGIAPVVTVNGAETTLTWNHMDDEAVLEAILPLTEDGVYAIAVNYANYLHTAEEKTITICRDTVDPEVTITYRDAEGKDVASEIVNHVGETVFADAVTAVITVKDVNFDTSTASLVVVPENFEGENLYSGEENAKSGWAKVEGKNYTWEYVVPLNQAADYDITFNCQDYANNAAETATADLAVDIGEKPDNYIYAFNNDIINQILEKLTFGFYNSNLNVTITIRDAISGVENVKVNYVVGKDAYQAGNVGGNHEFKAAPDDENIKKVEYIEGTNDYRITFTIPEEALTKDNQFNGYITVITTDYAGNQSTSSTEETNHVVVDNIKPGITVKETDPVNVVDNVKYFNGNIVLNANIFEANYFFHQTANVYITKDGKNYATVGHASGWYSSANNPNATNTITLTEDGDYVVIITYTDGSGNKMDDYTSGNMTLDTIAPVITVNNIKQNSANKDETYGFTITVSDINLDAETVQPKLTAVVKGEDGLYSTKEIELGDAKLSADGTTVTYTVENLDEDALYTLTCSAEDMSNNLCNVIQLDDGKTYETVNFSINRNGSTFGFGTEYMTELVNQYYVYSVYEDLVIVEVNVDPIENYIVTVNGEELVEGTHFTTEQTSNPGEWSIRTYTIDKSYFAEEGEYNVIVTSTDKAETTAYSDIKNLAIAFVVDQTAPVLTISGLQTGGRYQTEEQTVTLIPTDEGGRLNTLKVVVMDSDGNPLTDDAGNDISVRFDYSGEDLLNYLSENGDMVTFTIPTGLEHQVQISCTDCAVDEHGIANEYNGVFSRVTVSKNALVIFYANKSVFYGTLGGLAALIILIVVLLKKKKEKK